MATNSGLKRSYECMDPQSSSEEPLRKHQRMNKEKLHIGDFHRCENPPPKYIEDLKQFWDQGKDYTSIPISTLCHCTHEKEKKLIMDEDNNTDQRARNKKCIFIPRVKRGRYDKSIKIEREKMLQVGPYEKLLPGFLSWWGIRIKEWYKDDERGKEIKNCVTTMKKENIYVAGYLQSPPTSRYGSYTFTASFQDLINCYRASRKDCKSGSVYLLKAGTLSYNYENCYVIMVCMEEDKNGSLESFSSIYGEDIIEHNGCINSNGKLIDPAIVPHFRVKNLITDIYRENLKLQYEEIAFALYFQEEHERLECNKSKIKIMKTKHKSKFCIKKEYDGEKRQCPDEKTQKIKK